MESSLFMSLESKPVVERCFAVLVFGHVFTGNNRYIHHAAAARFADIRRLLRPVPDPAIMNSKISGIDVKPDFTRIRIVVDEIFFLEKQTQNALCVGTGKN